MFTLIVYRWVFLVLFMILFLLLCFCFGFLFAMGFFPNAVVGPWGVLVMYLKSYQGFNKQKKRLAISKKQREKEEKNNIDKGFA